MKLIDIGVNLTSSRFKKPKRVVERASEAGVSKMVLISCDYDSTEKNSQYVKKFDSCYMTVGFHPMCANQYTPEIAKFLGSKVVAIGEAGLDYCVTTISPEIQEAVFREQIQLAISTGLPLYCHERDAHTDFCRIMSDYLGKLPLVIVHCFTGNEHELKRYLDWGFYIGLTGFICAPRGKRVRKLCSDGLLPLDRLLIETDAPHMLPEGCSPPNEPANLVKVVSVLAECYQRTPQQIAEITTRNAELVFAFSLRE